MVPDKDAAGDEDLRVMDGSGEDYLYPASYFALIEVPAAVEESMLRASWLTLEWIILTLTYQRNLVLVSYL